MNRKAVRVVAGKIPWAVIHGPGLQLLMQHCLTGIQPHPFMGVFFVGSSLDHEAFHGFTAVFIAAPMTSPAAVPSAVTTDAVLVSTPM